MGRVYNFSAGPSMLPESVLNKAAAEMLDYEGTGTSVMEMSHRSKAFQGIIDSAEALVREIYKVPDNYKVLFLQARLTTSSQAVGQIRLSKRLRSTAMLLPQLHRRIRLILISPRRPVRASVTILTMFTIA